MEPIKIDTNTPPTVSNGKEMSANLKKSLLAELEFEKRKIQLPYMGEENQKLFEKLLAESNKPIHCAVQEGVDEAIDHIIEQQKGKGYPFANPKNAFVDVAVAGAGITPTPIQELEQSIRSGRWHTFRNIAGKIKAYNALRNQNRVCVEVIEKGSNNISFCHVWFAQFGKKMGDTFVVPMNPELLIVNRIYNIPQADYDKLLSNKI